MIKEDIRIEWGSSYLIKEKIGAFVANTDSKAQLISHRVHRDEFDQSQHCERQQKVD